PKAASAGTSNSHMSHRPCFRATSTRDCRNNMARRRVIKKRRAIDIERTALENALSTKRSSQKISSENKMASVTLEIQDALAVVTISNSPLNLFTWEMLDQLSDIIDEVTAAPIRALL